MLLLTVPVLTSRHILVAIQMANLSPVIRNRRLRTLDHYSGRVRIL